MILAVDAGNSRTKWGVFGADGKELAQGAMANAGLSALEDALRALPPCRCAVVSNVAGASVAARLSTVFDALRLPVRWVRSTAEACGVRNRYMAPAALGTDRWAALVAAWQTYRLPCVVVSAGTALTVDALSGDGDFLGGFIVPGLRMMREALADGTAAVDVAAGEWSAFPTNTAAAVHSGALVAMAGVVERMYAQLQAREANAPHCLLGGGDAETLAAVMARPVFIAHDLVLRGLFLMEQMKA